MRIYSTIEKGEMLKMKDKILICKKCGKEFIFTEAQQVTYQRRIFKKEPQLCARCRRRTDQIITLGQ